MKDELPLADEQRLTVAQPSPLGLIQEAIKQGLNAETVGVVERLVALQERMNDKQSEREFAAAFNALQNEMPIVKAVRPVEGKDKNTGQAFIKYHFAPYEDIMEQVRPLLLKHGFTVTFSMGFSEGRVIQNCTLMHTGGHSRTNTFMARVGGGPPGSSEAQGDGAAATFAKRYALCSALNIVCERDSDGANAQIEGKPVTEDQALWLEDMVKQTKSDKVAFLKYAGAPDFASIGSERFEALSRSLNKKLAGL
jgi:ERF superfamily